MPFALCDQVGSAKYVILCNAKGGIINDPVLLRLSEDEFWFSIADSGAGLWLQGVNAMGTYDVTIQEIDVAPLSIAGPYALDTVRALIGPCADDIPYFGLVETEISGYADVRVLLLFMLLLLSALHSRPSANDLLSCFNDNCART
jgi:glycine cleavage system aminomethyltransferase T